MLSVSGDDGNILELGKGSGHTTLNVHSATGLLI